MEVYLHRHGEELSLVAVDETLTVEDLIGQGGDAEGLDAWLEDRGEPLPRSATLEGAGVRNRDRITLSRCRKIDVQVRYAGKPMTRAFPPGATIASVFAWATGNKGFDLNATERAKHVLSICGTTTQPDRSDHIGAHADSECTLCLDLVPKERFEG